MAGRKMSLVNGAQRRLAGRYELVEVVGRGGMGTVYRARDLVLRRSVAVKILLGPLAEHDPTSIARFEREARAAAALSHPAVVAVYDSGADEASRFIVMEFIDGRSLEGILRDEGPLDPERAGGIAARVADALAAAHAAGIVHRDIKPANVMIAQDGAVKVLDFGIARAIDGTALTRNDSVLGTAAYMSPEQALGTPADERSDIYSLGCILYALLAGHPPFTGEGAAAIMHQHANVAPRSLRSADNHVSPALDALVTQMLAKAPGDRPQTAARVRDRLTHRSASTSSGPGAAASAARRRPTVATLPLARARHSEHRRRLLAGALGIVVLVVAVVALASAGSSPRAPSKARRERSGTRGHLASKIRATTAVTAPAAGATTAATTPTTTLTRTPTPRTVAGSAGVLTALSTQDVQSGTIDQQAAQQISNGLTNVLNAWETGNAMNAEQQLTNLSQQVAMLEQHGDITPAATPGINGAVANLSAALARTTPPATKTGGQPAPPALPPGHRGQPPGHAKHGGPHGH